MSGLDLTTKVKVVTLAPKQTLLRVQSRGMQGPPGVQGPIGAQGPTGPAGADAEGTDYLDTLYWIGGG